MDGLDQRGFAHAARAPQQRIVGGQAAREAAGVVEELVALSVDALEQRQIDAIDLRTAENSPRAARQTKASATAKSGARAPPARAARARRRCARAGRFCPCPTWGLLGRAKDRGRAAYSRSRGAALMRGRPHHSNFNVPTTVKGGAGFEFEMTTPVKYRALVMLFRLICAVSLWSSATSRVAGEGVEPGIAREDEHVLDIAPGMGRRGHAAADPPADVPFSRSHR